MPAKKKTATKKNSTLANVKLTITHIVPTAQFGNVTYRAECDAEHAKEVGLFMAELIGGIYPPYNPGEDIKEPVVHTDEETFNREAATLNNERVEKETENISEDDFDF